MYVIAQFLGAYLGYGLIMLITPSEIVETAVGNDGLCVTMPHEDVLPWQAFIVEFVATTALVWFCCGLWDPRNAALQDSAALKFGLAIAGLAAVTVS